MVKEFLSQRGVDFEERDVSRNPAAARELMRNSGQMGVPVTIINGQTVVGFDQAQLAQILSQTKASQHPSFGATIADAGKITAKAGSGIIFGAYVGKVKPLSSAGRAGLAEGDIVIEINLHRIANADDMAQAISSLKTGGHFTITFLRGDKRINSEGIL